MEIPRVPVSANAAEDARDVKESPRLDDARLSDSNTSSQAQWNEPKTVTAQFSAPQAAPPFDRAQNLISDSLVEIVIDSAVADHGGQQPWAASEKLNTATAEMLVEFLTSQVTELDIETVEGTRQKLISAIEQQIPIVAERERYPELKDENGPEFAPVKEMLASREDLAGLPVRGEEDCRIDAGESSAEWRFALAGIGLQ